MFFGWVGLSASPAALTPNAQYTITIQKMNSNGTTSDDSTTEATTDENGKLTFTLSSLPTNSDCNFIVVIIKDATGQVVRKGFVPAPPAGSTNLLGVNTLSTAQTNAVLAAAEVAQTDDPIAVAFILVLLRSPEATEEDARTLALLGKEAILGDNGFEGFLLSNGITATQLETFKSRLIYNPDSAKKTIADLMARFKTAVDQAAAGNTDAATKEMQKAGGFMADVFLDAGEAAGIDLTMIQAAHDAAGVVAQNDTNRARMLSITPAVRRSIEQAMSSFFQRLASIKIKSEYIKALTTLGASGAQVDRFLTAVNDMMTCNATIEETYGEYFMNPDAYVTANGTTHEAVQQAIGQAFNACFQTFSTAMGGTDDDINQMRSNILTAFQKEDPNFSSSYFPSDFGTYRDFSGTTKNWPIPQVVMVNWIASIINAGGSLTYTRDTLDLPSTMAAWMGTCSDPQYFMREACEGNGGTWAPGRRTYNTPSSSFTAYLGLMEDVQIIEFTRYGIYKDGPPTREQEKEARLLFQQRLEATAGRISGTTNGSTAISTAQKMAIIKLLMQPSMN